MHEAGTIAAGEALTARRGRSLRLHPLPPQRSATDRRLTCLEEPPASARHNTRAQRGDEHDELTTHATAGPTSRPERRRAPSTHSTL